MKTRSKLAAMVAATTVLALSGCATAGDGGDSADGGTVVYWQHSYETRDKLVTQFADEFQSDNEGTEIKTQFIPYDQYFDKLITALQSGKGPDVFQVPVPMAEQLISAGAVAPIPDSVISASDVESEYLPATVDPWKKDGKYYGLPTDVQTLLLFANSDLLQACGGDPANLPTTWDDLYAQAKKCTVRDANGDMTQAGLDPVYKWAVYTQAMYSMVEGDITTASKCQTNLTDPDVVDAWETASEFEVGDDSPASATFMPGQSSFRAGKAVFYINHPVTMSTLKDFPDVKYVVGQAPTGDGEPLSAVYSWAYVVNANSANIEEAWKFAYSMSDEAAQVRWFQETGSLPAMKKVAEDASLPTNDNERLAIASLTTGRPVQTIPLKADDITDAAWDEIVVGGSSVKDALASAKDQIDALIRDTLDCK